jgi:hypothetical protein
VEVPEVNVASAVEAVAVVVTTVAVVAVVEIAAVPAELPEVTIAEAERLAVNRNPSNPQLSRI